MPLLSKDAIESALRQLPTVDVPIPELGGDVRLRTLTGREREQFEMDSYEEHKAGTRNYRARLVALTLVDENGNPMFNELDAKNVLCRGNAAILDRIYTAAKKHNKLDPVDEDDVKNSGSGQASDSGTGSPLTKDAA